jgi:hypothetical protein
MGGSRAKNDLTFCFKELKIQCLGVIMACCIVCTGGRFYKISERS